MNSLDLNSDLGESDRITADSIDARIMPFISSCNVACGAHAGNKDVVADIIALAKQHNVTIGAHVSYVDRENFGRLSTQLSDLALTSLITTQIAIVQEACDVANAELRYIKLHGALYHDVNHDVDQATRFLKIMNRQFPHLAIVAMAGSILAEKCSSAPTILRREVFADRAYRNATELMPRSQPNALLDPNAAMQQVDQFVRGIISTQVGEVPIEFETVCIHSDTPQALSIAKSIHKRLTKGGITVCYERC